jgi:hypothetical protein
VLGRVGERVATPESSLAQNRGQREAKQPEIEAERCAGKVEVEPERGATSSGSSRENCAAG